MGMTTEEILAKLAAIGEVTITLKKNMWRCQIFGNGEYADCRSISLHKAIKRCYNICFNNHATEAAQ